MFQTHSRARQPYAHMDHYRDNHNWQEDIWMEGPREVSHRPLAVNLKLGKAAWLRGGLASAKRDHTRVVANSI